jgi:hypothetical protein
MPIKTFRGLIAHDTIDTVTLHTNDGSTGYRITKFQIMGIQPDSTTQESTVKIYKVPQTTSTATIDLSDQTLLAVAFRETYSAATSNEPETIIFDNEIINQDIYITHTDSASNEACNYYIELEQIKLDLNENTVATLKDIRNQA